MAISRREIIRLGVSYGTGAINFGNDSVAYERALRKLPEDTHLAEFLEELNRVTEVLAAEEADAAAAEAEAAEAAEAEAVAEAAEAEAVETVEGETADESAVLTPEGIEKPAEDAVIVVTDEADATPEAPRENPLLGAIEKAYAFRSFCASLALGELFIQTTALIATMQTACLPAVDDIEKLTHDYNAIIDYLKHC